MGEQLSELLTRGVDEVIGEDELVQKITRGQKLRVKLGIDPTSPHLHLGRSIPLLKLRDFEQAGHQVVFIVGDFTGVIGDTSDKDSERPMLTQDVIDANKEAYFAQVGKLIDLEKAEFRYNSEWLGPLTYHDIGEHADQFSVADFIARDNIRRRLDAGKRVSLREMLYPLMQGYDSVAVEADVELGGNDQRFNLLAGRTLQQHFNQEPQAVLMNALINGYDGRKMSSSWGNTINLDDEPHDMYGKVMRVQDDLMETYLTYCTRVPKSEVEALVDTESNPRDTKMRLAREIVTMYHNKDAANEAEQAFVSVFQNSEVPEHVEVVAVAPDALLMEALVQSGLVASNTEFRRLVDAGAICDAHNPETKVAAYSGPVTIGTTYKIGKRRFVRIEQA
jgi:tyrosyl-tRNA synthetase